MAAEGTHVGDDGQGDGEVDELLAMLIPREGAPPERSPTPRAPRAAPEPGLTAAAPPAQRPPTQAPTPPDASLATIRARELQASVQHDQRSRQGQQRVPLLVGAGIAALALLGLVAWLAIGGDDTETAGTETSAGEDGGDSSAADSTSSTPTSGSTSSSTGLDPSVPVAVEVIDSGEQAYGVIKDGVLHLRGSYPTPEMYEQATAQALEAMGEDGLVIQADVNPDVVFDPNIFRLVYGDPILFDRGSAELAPEFEANIADFGSQLAASPGSSVTVVSRTDADGSPEANLQLSEERAESVIAILLQAGATPAQVDSDARGEQDASEDATDEQKALDRSVELVIGGDLGTVG